MILSIGGQTHQITLMHFQMVLGWLVSLINHILVSSERRHILIRLISILSYRGSDILMVWDQSMVLPCRLVIELWHFRIAQGRIERNLVDHHVAEV